MLQSFWGGMGGPIFSHRLVSDPGMEWREPLTEGQDFAFASQYLCQVLCCVTLALWALATCSVPWQLEYRTLEFISGPNLWFIPILCAGYTQVQLHPLESKSYRTGNWFKQHPSKSIKRKKQTNKPFYIFLSHHFSLQSLARISNFPFHPHTIDSCSSFWWLEEK